MEAKYQIILYVFYFLVAVCFSVLTNWLFLRFSRNLGMRNLKDEQQIRWSSSRKPSLGGISFYIVFLLSISTLGILPDDSGGMFNKQLIGITAASSLGFLLGLADDAYNTNPLVKFIGQLTCAFILISMDVYIPLTDILAINFIVTVLWVIGLMNSINMLDNMDGITASTSASIIVGAIMIMASTTVFENTYMILLVGVLGALIGFLFFNWNPSKMYMGDTGSMFLGVFLASISMLFMWSYKDPAGPSFQFRPFVIPMLLFIVPLIDTTTVTIRRLMRKQSPFVGGRDHTTHHLAYLGLSDKLVAVTLLSVSLLSVLIVSLIMFDVIPWNSTTTIGAFVYFVVMFSIFQLLYNKGKARQEEKKKAEASA